MTRRPWMLVIGTVVVVAAVVPPLDHEAAEHFSMHMIQHMILVLVAAPLLSGSRILVPRFPLLRSIAVVAVLHAAALWAWHLPTLYDAAMENDLLHVLEHASFLVTAVMFWNLVLDPHVDRFKRLGLVFVTMLQSGALGAVIVFASAPLYGWHARGAMGSSDTVLQDQQLAGAIMWVPPGVVYLAVMVALLARALSAFEAAEER